MLRTAAVLPLVLLLAAVGAGKDLYETLGLKRDASARDIRKAYRSLSRKLHPDVNDAPDANEQFAALAHAYEVLSDEEKRQIYDRHGEEGLERQAQRSQQGSGSPFDFFDLFGGGGRRARDDPRTPDVEVPLRVTLKQLYMGDTLEVDYTREVLCIDHSKCSKSCPECQGPGISVRTQQLAPGFVQQVQQRDERCVARGKCWKKNCKDCPNGVTEPESIDLTVDVAPGMQTGESIVFEQVADEAPGHIPGSLVFRIVCAEHPWMRRDGADLHITLEINLVDALVGFRRTFQHLDDSPVEVVKDTVTHPGEVMPLRGKGMPIREGGRRGEARFGDLYITFRVVFPESLTGPEKEKAEALLRPLVRHTA